MTGTEPITVIITSSIRLHFTIRLGMRMSGYYNQKSASREWVLKEKGIKNTYFAGDEALPLVDDLVEAGA